MTDSAMPIQKVLNSTLAGAITIVFVWVLHQFAHVEVPGDVAAAITGIFMALVAYITPLMPHEVKVPTVPVVPIVPVEPPQEPPV